MSKEIEEMREGYSFATVHHSYFVNLKEVEKYFTSEGGYVVMSVGSSIVSDSRKEYL